MAVTTRYKAGDIIRLQLSPDGRDVRWWYSDDAADYMDNGYGGDWVDALIIATSYEPGNYHAWPSDPIALVNFDNLVGKTMTWQMPLESNPRWPQRELPGWPKPAKADVPKCDCGADSIYGISNMCHDHWCSKGKILRALGFVK